MALIINSLARQFAFSYKGERIVLDDPNPKFTPEEVMAFLAGTYPVLTNGTISGPEIEEDKVVYTFKTTLGEKG
jgi:PRTRC genetic system protein C